MPMAPHEQGPACDKIPMIGLSLSTPFRSRERIEVSRTGLHGGIFGLFCGANMPCREGEESRT
jgi:hypothetical protein